MTRLNHDEYGVNNPAFKRPAGIDVLTQQKKMNTEKSVEKTEPVVQKELDPTMSRILEEELQQLMNKVWEELPESPACETEKMVVDKLRREAGDDLKRLLGLNVSKRLLNVHNPIYVKVEFDIKPEGENLMQFLRWLNVTSMKRERGGAGAEGGAANEGGAHHYLVQLRKISDYDRALRVKKIKFGTLKASITSGYNFEECPPKLKSIYSQRKTKEEYAQDNEISEALNKKPNVIEGIKKNPGKIEPQNKVDAKGDNTKEYEAVDKAKENNTCLKKTPTKPTVNKTPATQTKPIVSVSKKPEPAKNVAKVVSKPAVELKNNNNPAATSKSETNAKKETNVANTTVTKTGSATVKNTAVKVTTPQKATAEVSKVAAEKVKVQTAAKTTKPLNQGLTPTTKPAPKRRPAPKVTPKKIETKKKKVSDFDELDDEDILALMSNAIVLDECRGSDDEN